jgi:hypothetical protein
MEIVRPVKDGLGTDTVSYIYIYMFDLHTYLCVFAFSSLVCMHLQIVSELTYINLWFAKISIHPIHFVHTKFSISR